MLSKKFGVTLILVLSLFLIPFLSAYYGYSSAPGVTKVYLDNVTMNVNNSQFLEDHPASYFYPYHNPLNFYSPTDFSIADYYLKSNPFGYYNITTAPIYVNDTFGANYSDYLITKNYSINDTDFNLSGLIKDWNSTGFIINWTEVGDIDNYYPLDNPFGYYNITTAPIYLNDTFRQNYSTYLGLFNWNKTYADTLYYGIGNAYGYYNSTNPQPVINTSYYLNSNPYGYYNSTNPAPVINTSYYLATNPFSFYNSTTLPASINYSNATGTFVPYTGATGNVDLNVKNLINLGKIGIGLVTPVYSLDVNDTTSQYPIRVQSTSATLIKLNETDTGAGLINFVNNDNQTGWYVGITANENFGISNAIDTETNPSFIINGNRSVGINTANPLATLSVYSLNQATDSLYSTHGNFYVGTTDNQSANVGGGISLGGRISNGSSTMVTYARIIGRKENLISSNADGYLAFEVDNDALGGKLRERMRITSTGDVGIGTTSPGYKLTVNDTSGAGYGQTFLDFHTSPSGGAIGSTRNLSFFTNGTSKVSILDNGNMGIANAAPDNKLTVSGGYVGIDYSYGIQIDNSSGSPKTALYGGSTGTTLRAINTVGLSFENSTGNRIAVIDDTGRVGIGTTAPTVALDIKSTTGIQNYRYSSVGSLGGYVIAGHSKNDTIGGYTYLGTSDEIGKFIAQAPNNGAFQTIGGLYMYSAENQASGSVGSYMTLKTTPNGTITPVDVMTLTQNGNVGIGLTAPTSKLHVNGSTNITGNLIVGGNMSIKRPYGMFSDNTTQIIGNVATAQVINFSTTEDNYMVNIEGKQNFSVQQSGDYKIDISAIFTVDTNSDYIQLWVQKWNGTAWNNLARSNTRMQLPNANTEIPLAVPFILDLTTTEKFRLMTATSNAGSSLVYTTNTSYSPETPSIILTIHKISEITP